MLEKISELEKLAKEIDAEQHQDEQLKKLKIYKENSLELIECMFDNLHNGAVDFLTGLQNLIILADKDPALVITTLKKLGQQNKSYQ
jgi:hypothetical protein